MLNIKHLLRAKKIGFLLDKDCLIKLNDENFEELVFHYNKTKVRVIYYASLIYWRNKNVA